MNDQDRLASAVLLLTAIGCGPDAVGPADDVSIAMSSAPATAAPTAGADVASAGLTMYPVASIYSLIDVIKIEGGLELRLGVDWGGGTRGQFRYVPLVDGVPDFSRETGSVHHADTTGVGHVTISGKRPNLFLHSVSGFRSEPGESYSTLDEDLQWGSAPGLQPSAGLGYGVFAWTKDRLLEWRGPHPTPGENPTSWLPELRVVQGSDKTAPSVSKALKKQLTDAGFVLATYNVLRTGEVIAIGRLTKAHGFGTVVWADKLEAPSWFATDRPADDDAELKILGGTTLADLRVQVVDRVMKLDGASWAEESKVVEGKLPDVWFGSPQVVVRDDKYFARVSKTSGWELVPLPSGEHDFRSMVVDDAGAIWMTVDDTLFSNRPPKGELLVVTEEEIVARRKKSVFMGGSPDVTGAAPEPMVREECRMSYVLLYESKKPATATDIASIRAALKPEKELANAKLVVSHERGWELIGLPVKGADLAFELEQRVKKRNKKLPADSRCAEPVVDKEIPVTP